MARALIRLEPERRGSGGTWMGGYAPDGAVEDGMLTMYPVIGGEADAAYERSRRFFDEEIRKRYKAWYAEQLEKWRRGEK